VSKVPIASVELSESTWAALTELADIRGIATPERFPKLLQDAMRVFEWVLYQQAVKGRVVVALERADLEALESNRSLQGQREQLAPLAQADRTSITGDDPTSKVRQYFAKAVPKAA
jgi:hypothetical protein